ncbi:type II secretion system F family protein [Methylothermus subterraneus]
MAVKAKESEAILFVWEGIDKSGKRVKGEQPGRSEALIKAQLRQQGIKPIKVRKKPKPLFGARAKKITPKDIAVFSRQLATMLTAGVPLVQAFEIVGHGHENPSMQKLILEIKADIEAGGTLTEALRKHPLYFDELFCNLVHAGEQAGVLETLLDKIATYKEKTESLKGKVKKALFYPTAVIVVACIVTAILLIFVIPQFEELFKGFGADLPAFTQLVIELSRFMQASWYYLLGALLALGYVFFYFKKRSKAFNHFLDRVFLKIPILGPQILHKSAIARFARTLSTMSAAGVPLVEALSSVAGASGNAVYAEAILEMREQVATGQQLQLAMRQTGLFPHMVVQMVAIGEESGAIDSMLAKVADFYEEEVDNAVDALSSLMEPMIMAFLGVVVGGLVIAMYLPIFKLGSVV